MRLFLATLFIAMHVLAGVVIPGPDGNSAQTLFTNLRLFDAARIVTGTADPTSTATDGEPGSLYLRDNGSVYRKTDTGLSTNWVLLDDILRGLSCTSGQLAEWDGSAWVCGNKDSIWTYDSSSNLFITDEGLPGTPGTDNICIGQETCQYLGSGSQNTAIGGLAARNLNGSGNVAIGYATGSFTASETVSNALLINNESCMYSINGTRCLIEGSFSSDFVDIGGDLGVRDGKQLRLYELDSNGANYIAFDRPDSIASNRTITVPDEDIDLSQLPDLVTLSGLSANSTDLGTFTGTTIPDTQTIKQALQSLETAQEETDANSDDLVTLSGVAENATDLGTFTGTTIPDTQTIKQALQSLETALEDFDITGYSSLKTTAGDNVWINMPTAGVSVSPGTWRATGLINADRQGGADGFTQLYVLWTSENGADTATQPTTINSVSGVTLLVGSSQIAYRVGFNSEKDHDDLIVPLTEVVFTTTSSFTLYATPLINFEATGVWDVTIRVTLERIQ